MRYFEDIEIGKQVQAGPYEVSEAEIIEFATRWDPRSHHTDPKAALQTPFRGLANQSGEVVLEIMTTGLFAKRPR